MESLEMRGANRRKLIILVLVVFFTWLLFLQRTRLKEDSEDSYIVEGLGHSRIVPRKCMVPEWNKKTTNSLPHAAEFEQWRTRRIGSHHNILDAESRLLSAFVYPDQISIVTTAFHTYGKRATCLYYDCNRREIPSSRFKSRVVPLTVVTCPRRYGAEYVSLSFDDDVEPQEPIPLIFRAYEQPVHELSVCVGPLYGPESKWLEVVEYVEHYRLLGTSMFYFTLFNMNDYDRKIVDDYERLGLAESTKYFMEYVKLGWMFHLIQTHECHHRSRFHSKWVINMDIDERLIYNGPNNFIHFMRSIPPAFSEISLSSNRVLKFEELPEKFKSEEQLLADMMFLKYNQTTEISWYNLKGIVRPEMVALLFYHWSCRQFDETKVMSVSKRFAYVRHYRSVDENKLNSNWRTFYNGSLIETRLEESFEKRLTAAVLKRVKYVYDQRMIHCEEIPPWIFNRFERRLLDCNFRNESQIIDNENTGISGF
ncbi:hypothetical protein GCK72_019260 [Caenorhabditis remanei]|uniref:Glycosyltransferase family 92 protein n=1 Tax=Caenorhabditis remanei TaxID=31234 RepID=A0A6A5GDH5_CAERE|nr:hypothetical protein GCK72_019260 [Caenorhabditis remanei]KAF1752705.1 hypothetical protein GCK72_019260 [Caenorhabditis remanei]